MSIKQGISVAALSLICAVAVFAQTFGTKKRMPRPNEYGNVVMDNYSSKAEMAGVVFAHWLHRSKFTCRLCHVDLGFAMAAGETQMREDDNRMGLYCGACHDGKVAFGATGEDGQPHCVRCHSEGQEVDFAYDFYDLVKGFPRSRFGNRVDWLKAEEEGRIQLSDYLEGVSIRRGKLEIPLETEIEAKVYAMPDIIFSHEKHAVWNGCELCHPQIFGVKKAGTVYEMQDIFDGKFCGACHGKVAFMNLDCQLCHTKNVYE